MLEACRALLVKTWVQLLLLVVVTSSVYFNSLGNEFVWDDKTFINWQLTRSFGNIGEFLRGSLPAGHLGDYRPLKGIILAVDYKLFGLAPLGYHAQAIFLHLITTVLVYVVSKKILAAGSGPFLAAVLFGVHPVHTEAITFVTASTDMVGVSFALGAFWLYIKATSQFRNRKALLGLSVFLAFLAFIAYEATLVLPLLLVLYDKCYRPDSRFSKGGQLLGRVLRRWPQYCLYLAVIAVYAFVRFGILKVSEGESWVGESFNLTMIAMTKVVVKYLELTIFPLNLSINQQVSEGIPALTYVDYDPAVFMAQKWWDIWVILGVGIVGGLLILAVFLYKKLPIVTFCIFWFMISLLPFSNVIPLNNLMAERYLYLASFGWCLLVAYLVMQMQKLGKIIGVIGAVGFGGLLTFYSVRTVMRNMDWQDSYILWSRTLEAAPGSTLALNNLANSLKEQGRLDEAISLYVKAESQNTRKVASIGENLGITYFEKGQFDLALPMFLKAVEYNPTDWRPYFYLGEIYSVQNRPDEAIMAYEKCILANPAFFDCYFNLGQNYAKLGDFGAAVKIYKQAQNVDARKLITYLALSSVYEKQGEIDLAIDELERAAKIAPHNREVDSRIRDLTIKKKFVPKGAD